MINPALLRGFIFYPDNTEQDYAIAVAKMFSHKCLLLLWGYN